MLRRGASSLTAAVVSQLMLSVAVAQEATPPSPERPPIEAVPAPEQPPVEAASEKAVPAPEAPPPVPEEPSVARPAEPAEAVPGPGATERTEEIVVTGSRIRRKDLTTPAPVVIINREQIEASGRVSIGDFLQALPEQGNALNTQINNGNDGSVRVNLRSLNSFRTLVLVNGRRMVNGGTTVGDGPDLNTIPAAAVERIEILKDGASAVYGSDAVAGVVNVILKKSFRGTEVSGYTGTSSRGDGTTYDLSAITGTRSDKGKVLFSVGYQEQQKVLAGDRQWSETFYLFDFDTRLRIPDGNAPQSPEGNFDLPVDRDASGKVSGCLPGGTTLYTSLCNTAIAENYNTFVPGGGTTYTSYDGSWFNTNPSNYLITPNRRVQLFATGDTSIGDVARGFFEASYVNRRSAQTLAPMPVWSTKIPDKPVTVSADSIYNPFGVDITTWQRRAVEFGDRFWHQDLDTFRVVVGADGSLGEWARFLDGWNWELSYNYGRTAGTEMNDGILRMPNVANATGPSLDPDGSVASNLGASGDEICVRVPGDPATVIPGCAPWDLLHGVPASVDPRLKSYLTYTGTLTSFNRQEIYSANVVGDLFPLFAERPMALAAGVDYRKESGEYQPDVISASLESANLNMLPTKGEYDVKEGYAELNVPILSGIPWAEDLEAIAAVRVVDYSTFGTNTSYKLGARYSPFRDVSLRGTASTAFRAPNIAELFGGASDNYPYVSDPCSSPIPEVVAQCQATTGLPSGDTGDASVQLLERWISSPDLQPETANIYTAGVVLQPRWVANLSATVDYYNIRVNDAIGLTGAPYILNRCYPTDGSAPDQAMCDLVIRDVGPSSAGTGRILQINDPRTNRFTYETSGLDLALRYGLPTPSIGRFNFLFDATWLLRFDLIDPFGDDIEGKGNYDLAYTGTGGALPAFKFNAGVGWSMHGLSLGVATRYVGPFQECGSGFCSLPGGEAYGKRTISYHMPFDVYAGYALKTRAGRTSINAGVRNVLDSDPPFIATAFDFNSDPSTYDYIGRFFYVRLTQGF